MGRVLGFIYGLIAYVLFFVSFIYAAGFVGNLVVPKSIDSGIVGPTVTALVVDAALLMLFAIQHSGMARRGFKRWITRFIPQPIERSTYVLVASSVLLLLYALWRPVSAPIWQVTAPLGVALLWTLFGFGWIVVFLSTLMIGHFDLFGLKQVWINLKGGLQPTDRFRAPVFYRVVRHPIMLGFLIAFWATPFMSVGHLLFSIATTGYILIAVQLEERDLIAVLGDEYRRYKSLVPGFIPALRRSALAILTLSTAALVAAACNEATAPGVTMNSAAPRFSNGQKSGQCYLQSGVTATPVEPSGDGGAVASAPGGEVVTGVAIKAGTACSFTPTGVTGTYTFVVDGTPCYIVAGLGTPTATVTRVRDDATCKDISHIEFTSGVALPPDPGEDG